jgi:hypothetical protein
VYGDLSGVPIVGALKCTESSKQSDSYMTKQEQILKMIEEENKKQYLLPEMLPKKDEVVEYGRFMPILPEVRVQENASLKVNYSEKKTEDFSLPSLPSEASYGGKRESVAFFYLFTKKSILPFVILYSLICYHFELDTTNVLAIWCNCLLPILCIYTYVPQVEDKCCHYVIFILSWLSELLLEKTVPIVNRIVPKVEELPKMDDICQQRGGDILNLSTNSEKPSKNITFKCHTSIENQRVVYSEIDSDSHVSLVEQNYFKIKLTKVNLLMKIFRVLKG